jgi:hypothetical protein
MKNLTLIAFLFLPLFSIAQTKKPIESFLGIKFGSSVAQVKTAMLARGSTFDTKNSKAELLLFDQVTLGSRKTSVFGVKFINGQAYCAIFIFKPELQARTLEFYNDLKKDMTEVYGDGESKKTFKYPYKDGDGDELMAIESGNADYSTLWFDDKRNVIAEKITSEMEITLIYQDAALESIASEKDKAKEKADF